jgi:hypothetical protein
MRSSIVLSVALLALAQAASGPAAEVGTAIEVASQAEKTRYQTWASAAWSEGAKCWLVAWREGFLNEAETGSDIWCARVSADGKALDPAGIRLTKGPGLKDRPEVASDGKGWLVVWEDLRNGKDPSATGSGQGWDVYAGRVTGDGKALDPEGVLVAGGEHNQCRPDVAFDAGNYYAVWQALGVSSAHKAWQGYSVQGARVSPDGKVLDKPVDVGVNASQCTLPVAASHDGSMMVAFNIGMFRYVGGYVARREVDPTSGQPRGTPPADKYGDRPPPLYLRGENIRTPALAMGTDGGLLAAGPAAMGDAQRMGAVLAVDKSGGAKGEPYTLGPRKADHYSTPRVSVAAAGDKQFLVVMDHPDKGRFNVCGWRFGPDGKPVDDAAQVGFPIVADAAKDSILPSVASGPGNSCLVVYSEVRGADDVKVLARVVK